MLRITSPVRARFDRDHNEWVLGGARFKVLSDIAEQLGTRIGESGFDRFGLWVVVRPDFRAQAMMQARSMARAA